MITAAFPFCNQVIMALLYKNYHILRLIEHILEHAAASVFPISVSKTS
jgi:hypothetical protein